MARNMCYDQSASEIHDTLMGEDGITKDDLITAVIGLCNVVSIQDTNYRLMSARLDIAEQQIEILKALYDKQKGVKECSGKSPS